MSALRHSGYFHSFLFNSLPEIRADLLCRGCSIRGQQQIKLRIAFFFVIKPTRCTNFTNLFCHETLHVSDSSCVRHQEFIHCTLSNGICHTGLYRGEFRPRQTRQLPRAVDLKGRLLSCQSY